MSTDQPLLPATPLPPSAPQKRGKGCLTKVLAAFGLVVVLSIVFAVMGGNERNRLSISLSQFNQLMQDQELLSVNVGQDMLVGQFRKPQASQGVDYNEYEVALPPGVSGDWQLTRWLLENATPNGIHIRAMHDSNLRNILLPILPWLMVFLYVFYAFNRAYRQQLKNPRPSAVYVVPAPPTEPTSPAAADKLV